MVLYYVQRFLSVFSSGKRNFEVNPEECECHILMKDYIKYIHRGSHNKNIEVERPFCRA